VKVGAFEVDILVDAEGSFATMSEAFPAMESDETWTPGHSPGHMSVWVESQGSTLVVLGDAVVHEVQVADPDLIYVSDHDASLAATTRRAVLGRLADEGTDVIVSHFHGVGRFARAGQSFSWTAPAKEQAAPVE
jgi:glyoxylase-like metal-dependent hydrolase (beta-lactamase superfamily II)